MSDNNERISVRLLVDGEPCTLADFLDANAEDEDSCSQVSSLVEGDSVTLGGGAQAEVVMYRMHKDEVNP